VSTDPPDPSSEPVTSSWQRFRAWLLDVKPTDVLGVLFAAASVGLSIAAIVVSERTADKQSKFEREQSAPVLAPETPPEIRGRPIPVTTQYEKVRKRADRLLVRTSGRGHVIVPMRNGGSGIALTVGLPVLVQDCDREPAALPSSAVGLLGTYSLPSGAYDQLAYFQPKPSLFRAGSVEVDGKRFWYGWDYVNFGKRPKPTSQKLLLWYTDGARRKLRWTCTTYSRQEATPYGRQYAVSQQIYGSKDVPEDLDSFSR
jgi:hypothetical protein